MTFEDWKAELRRIWHHEGGGRRDPVLTPEQLHAAFVAGTAPWAFYEAELSWCPGSIDDIPVLGDEDDLGEV